jgi:hypothetical protein
VTLLSSTFALHDVRDVESFTGQIVERSGLRLSVSDREELHVYLIEECWLLSRRYDGSGGSRFAAWAKTTLGLRCIDWQRQRYGRTRWKFAGYTYERGRPQLVSLDADDPEHYQLGTTLTGGGLDRDASGFAADMRALDRRGRRPRRRRDCLGDEAA